MLRWITIGGYALVWTPAYVLASPCWGTYRRRSTMEFGQWVREARGRRSWSRSALARRSGLPENTIRRLETGETAPRWPTLLKIIDALGEAPPLLGSSGSATARYLTRAIVASP